jgi:hypothetical protein
VVPRREEKEQFSFFPFALGVFAFFGLVFSSRSHALYFASRRELESAKNEQAPKSC